VYEGTKETYQPVKEVTAHEQEAFMSNLYERCKETRAKTRAELADKYLKPLARPAASRAPTRGGKGAGAAAAAAGAEGKGA
jgi:hypothetical protein